MNLTLHLYSSICGIFNCSKQVVIFGVKWYSEGTIYDSPWKEGIKKKLIIQNNVIKWNKKKWTHFDPKNFLSGRRGGGEGRREGDKEERGGGWALEKTFDPE